MQPPGAHYFGESHNIVQSPCTRAMRGSQTVYTQGSGCKETIRYYRGAEGMEIGGEVGLEGVIRPKEYGLFPSMSADMSSAAIEDAPQSFLRLMRWQTGTAFLHMFGRSCFTPMYTHSHRSCYIGVAPYDFADSMAF